MDSLVSVIITTYKRSDFLPRAINSVLNQTYENLEIIVVDDNGPSNFRIATKNKVKKLIEEQKVMYIEHPRNRGISAARNTGILNASGDYIAFLDDDDEFLPNKIELQINFFQNSEKSVGLLYGAYKKIFVQNGKEEVLYPQYKGDLSKVLGLNYIGPPSMVMCSKTAIEMTGGFDEDLRSKEDIDFYLRLSEFYDISYINEILIKYYVHPLNASKAYPLILKSTYDFIEKNYTRLKKPKQRWSEILERLGEVLILNGQRGKARKVFLKAFFSKPSRIKLLIKIIVSFKRRELKTLKKQERI